jgi:hypothetical protein
MSNVKTKKEKTPKPIYPKDKGEEIVAWLSSGKFLTEYCAQANKPGRTTIYDWMDKSEEFAEQIARARERGQEILFEQNMKIVDEVPPTDDNGRTDAGYVAWQKNRVWTRLQMLAKMNPKKYGDKSTTAIEGGLTLTVETGVPPRGE